jgi:gluconolactonase
MKLTQKIFVASALSLGALTAMKIKPTPVVNPRLVMMADSTSDLFEDGTKAVLVSDQFGFTEGPSPDKKGNVYFTDQNNDKIWMYSLDGKLTVWMDSSRRANGTYFDKKGNLITCAELRNEIISISPDKKITTLVKDIGGKFMNGPNDVFVTEKGDMYFSDPFFQRSFWKHRGGPGMQLDGQKVYLVRKGTSEAVPVVTDMRVPNGVVGTPDGKYLYVADYGGRKTFKYTIEKDGTLSNKTPFADLGSDGMCLDNKGNVYLTGRGVTVYNKDGKRIAQIPVPSQQNVTNLCFAGKNRDIMFITTPKAVFTMQMRVKGIE